VTQKFRLLLSAPNVVVDETDGSVGNFTLIYDEGVEIHLNSRKYFAFSSYKKEGSTVVSLCNETFPGWYHNSDGSKWGCFYGVQDPTAHVVQSTPNKKAQINPQHVYQAEHELVNQLNSNQKLWKAAVNPKFVGKTIEELRALTGNTPVKPKRFPKKVQNSGILTHNEASNKKGKKTFSQLPTNFDWRNVSGQNFVSPVRNQGGCGSCYTFATTGMLEARVRVLTNNTLQPILSPQHVVSCSEYSQGCDGGFNYLVSKFGEDFGIFEEVCYPYEGTGSACVKPRHCTDKQKWHATNYYYVGGYFGACSAELIMEELYSNGPLAISFEVYNDFFAYHGGIYFHNSTASQKYSINPWEETNHAVLLVGWGEEGGVPFWTCKNSWDKSFGEEGFFRIARGVDECGIESMAVAATPVW